jgi:hypothetical protein
MLFVSFHKSIPNVYAFDDDGNPLSSGVLNARGQALDELRGIYLGSSSGLLYVVNGGKETSNILCFRGTSATSYTYLSTFLAPSQANSIDHPFAAAFDGSGGCYVSNQDTNVVAAFTVDQDQQGAGPRPVAAYLLGLDPGGTFLQGTLVASSVGCLPDVPTRTTPVPESSGGLGVIIEGGKVQHSVRDVAVCGALLLVVDEAAGLVRIYDQATGDYRGRSNVIPSPTHLLIVGEVVYLSASDQVLSSRLPGSSAPTLNFTPVLTAKHGSLSGMAVDGSGNCYVADRTEKELRKYGPGFAGPHQWSTKLTDEPEFLLYVHD